MRPKLSIILPCYNMENQLDRCIESIFAQEMDFIFEIIAVNDASTDGTLPKLKTLSQLHNNIRIINHSKNLKLTGARTSGIKAAKGEYIMHMDPDDYLLPNTIEGIFNRNTENWDVLICNILDERPNGECKLRYTEIFPSYLDLNEYEGKEKLFDSLFRGACVAKIIKKSLVDDMVYYDFNYNMGEDRAFNYELFNRARFISIDRNPIYMYKWNESSLDRGKFNSTEIDKDNNWIRNVVEFEKKNGYDLLAHKVMRRIADRYAIGLLLKINNSPEKKSLFNSWKLYLTSFDHFFGHKYKIYQIITRIKPITFSIFLLLISLGQIAPYKERLLRILKKIYIL